MRQAIRGMGIALLSGGLLLTAAAAQTIEARALVPVSPPAPTPATAPMAAWGSGASEDPVGPGDLLDVRVFGQPQLSASLRVAPNGVIAPPFLPSLPVAGQTPLAIETELTKAYSALLQHPLVSVRLTENNSRKVSINGVVPRPGVYAFSGQLTLLQALALAGGVNPSTASSEVLLLHQPPVAASRNAEGKLVYTANSILRTIDVAAIPSDPALNVLLQPGDIIDVEPVRQVYLSGDVLHPGSGPLLPHMTLAQLISAAGGFLPQANHTVRVLRLAPGGQRRTISVNVDAAQHAQAPELRLAPDDIVLVSGSAMRMAGLELLDFFSSTGRWKVDQTVADRLW